MLLKIKGIWNIRYLNISNIPLLIANKILLLVML